MSLVIINGILTFMLTPGEGWLQVAGTGREASAFWTAFFNPTYWPSLLVRTLVCIALAGVWALVTSSRMDGEREPELKTSFVRWSAQWLVPSFILMPLAFLWLLSTLPDGRSELLNFGISTIGQGVFTQVTRMTLITIMASATLLAIVQLLAYRTPLDFRFPQAMVVLFLALLATGSAESTREMLRKPWIVVDHMYSNGIRKDEVDGFQAEGYLSASPWRDALGSTAEAHGELMLRGQCLSCHTRDGYRSLETLLAGRDAAAIDGFLALLHPQKADSPYRAYMPPLVGSAAERTALRDALLKISEAPAKAAEAPR